jgi:hypothetical protein
MIVSAGLTVPDLDPACDSVAESFCSVIGWVTPGTLAETSSVEPIDSDGNAPMPSRCFASETEFPAPVRIQRAFVLDRFGSLMVVSVGSLAGTIVKSG